MSAKEQTETQTPRTDALERELEDSPVNIETACEFILDHARTLERELTVPKVHATKEPEATTRTNKQLRREYRNKAARFNGMVNFSRQLESELTTLQNDVRRLVAAVQWAQVELGKHTRPSPLDTALSTILANNPSLKPE